MAPQQDNSTPQSATPTPATPAPQATPAPSISMDTQKTYLQSTLQNSTTLNNDQRDAIWRTFTQSTDAKDFTTRANSNLTFMGNDAKDTLYRLRYQPERFMDAQGNPLSHQNQLIKNTDSASQPPTGTPPVEGPQSNPSIAPKPPVTSPGEQATSIWGQVKAFASAPLMH